MPLDFSTRTALVTGGSSGIGEDLARAMVDAGAKVAITGRREELLRETAERIGALAIPGDVQDVAHCEQAVATCVEEFGSLTTLVNNAGVLGRGGTADTPAADWERILGVNVHGVANMSRAAIPALRRAEGASILHVGSVAGTRPFGVAAAYCVSKAAVHMLARCQALELAPDGIRVNVIAPGVVVTHLHDDIVDDYQAFLEASSQTHPLGVGQVADTTSIGLFLCSDAARWVTGGIFPIDGGRAL